MSYSYSTVEALSGAIAALYAAPTAAEAIEASLDSLRRTFSCHLAVVDETPAAALEPSMITLSPVKLHVPAQKSADMADFLFRPSTLQETSIRRSWLALAAQRKRGETSLHGTSTVTPHFRHQLGISITIDRGALCITFLRERPFTDEERFMAEQLRPHLATVLSGALPRENEAPQAMENRLSLTVTKDGDCVGVPPIKVLDLIGKYIYPKRRSDPGLHPLPDSLKNWIRVSLSQNPQVIPDESKSDSTEVVAPGGCLRITLAQSASVSGYQLSFHEKSDAVDWFELKTRGLTSRECEVLFWIAQGKRDSEIAVIIGVARKTVGKHVERILRKLSSENRLLAARSATDWLRSNRAQTERR